MLKLVNIGFGNTVMLHKVVGIVSPESASAIAWLKMVKAQTPEKVFSGCYGKKMRSVIITSDGFIFTSALSPSVLATRMVAEYVR